MRNEVILKRIEAEFTGRVQNGGVGIDMPNILVPPAHVADLCRFLKDDPELRFDFLSDLCGVDFFPATPRFEVVYHLYSIPFEHRIRLKCRLGDPPVLPTVTGVWQTANWHERETYDMYGITFEGHPDLRRIYMWEEFEGYPMRKDYPLRGYKDELNPFGEPRG